MKDLISYTFNLLFGGSHLCIICTAIMIWMVSVAALSPNALSAKELMSVTTHSRIESTSREVSEPTSLQDNPYDVLFITDLSVAPDMEKELNVFVEEEGRCSLSITIKRLFT